MSEKIDGRGKHGKQGRKATGRVRDKTLSVKFSEKEFAMLLAAIAVSGKTQADFILLKCLEGE